MKLTVADIYNFSQLKTMNLIAGAEGMNKEVGACGILDYEFDSAVSDKYSDFNYRQTDFMTLTSFMYAKDNEFLIMDAVKRLIAKGGSGLIIKNVFNLTIHENVIKYADYMKFPIFIMEDKGMLFEDIIILISKNVEHYRSLDYRAAKTDAILKVIGNKEEVTRLARDINISFRDDILTIYFYSKEPLKEEDYVKLESRFARSGLFSAGDALFYYKNGMMLVYTADMFPKGVMENFVPACLSILGEERKNFKIGVSRIHHFVEDIGYAMTESIDAAKLHNEMEKEFQQYDDLGIYRILMPYVHDEIMRKFSMEFVEKLNDYDAETNGQLLSTAITYIRMDGDIQKTGNVMNQHPNTIRNRLNKIGNIVGINVIGYLGYEQLSLAIKIYLCQQI